MKFSKSLLTASAVLIGTVLVGLPLYAQSLALRVNIPFEFSAGQHTLPAGTYIVEKRGDVLLISDGKGNTATILSNGTRNKAYKMESMVVFHRYGDQRFLSEVRWSDSSTARALMETPAERRLAKGIPAEPTTLAAINR